MFLGLISIAMLAWAGYLLKNPINKGDEQKSQVYTRILQFALVGIGLFLLGSRSFVIIGANEVGHLERIYLAANLPPGKIIAPDGEKGPQSEIIGPGFHFMPFVRILNEVNTDVPVVEIAEGQYGILNAKDGLPLRQGQFIADEWQEEKFQQMLNATHFLTEGKGQKGPQLTVLRPGKYRINRYLFDVKAAKALDVPTGHVAVIRSNVQTNKSCPTTSLKNGKEGAHVATPIVPKGCIGVWDEPLPPGRYYLNNRAYIPTIIPTRLRTWVYKGGYTRRKIDLRVDDNGKISQTETAEKLPVPKNAASSAILVRVEGWTVPVEMRVVVQVHPKNAPIVVATIGNLQKVEDNIITPAIRDILRTIGGVKERKALDFMLKREEIVTLLEKAIVPEGLKAGVSIQEVRMGEPAIPPELLVATLREQLAAQLKTTYIKEQQAQKQRIAVERERATADQQGQLVKAEIAKQAAKHRKRQLQLEGEGEKLKLIEIAKGQQAQANVLGKERAMQLQALEKTLDAAIKNPAIVKVPTVLVNGTGTGYAGAAAVLGASNLLETIKGLKANSKKR
ncbi:MAG: hypothetical protein KAT06_09120 [Gammaproteobacteria bacterium]|nr:hypothetical protein [Gammaproteobacteria bacterium]